LPDAVSGIALSLAVNSSGAVTVSTIPLITAEEIDAAAKKTGAYRAPGEDAPKGKGKKKKEQATKTRKHEEENLLFRALVISWRCLAVQVTFEALVRDEP